MNRILWWAMSTLSAVVLMFGYHTSTSGAGVAGTLRSPTSISSNSSSAATSGASSGSTATSQIFTGSAVDTRYGPVRVTITASGGKITDVSVPQYPNNDSRDREINQRALPILIQETLDQQTANVDMVSGATYTSDGYRQSLQSALDEARL